MAPRDPNPTLYPDEHVVHELEKQGDNDTAFGDKSPGVRQIEAIARNLTKTSRWVLWVAVFLTAYAYTLDLSIRYTYQSFALSDFGTSAQVSTVSVVRSIVAAAAQPLYAKISDYFGRLSILFIAVLFYVVGTIVQAASNGLNDFLGGAVLYQFGYTGTQLLVEILVADTTSLQSRLFFSFIPSSPYLINTWISANVSTAVMLDGPGWKWGIGMFAIIFPALTIPLFLSLFFSGHKARRAGLLEGVPSPIRSALNPSMWKDIFWQLDLVGIILIAGAFIMILLPFTLYGGVGTSWASGTAIAPIVVGVVVVLPMFVLWELKFARHPAVPFRILKDRQVLAALGVACLLNAAWYCQGDYLYYTLLVAFNQSYKSTAYIQNIYTFVSTFIGITLGLVIRKVHRLKWFVVFGTGLSVVSFGLLIHFRSAEHGGVAGLIAAEVLLGVSFGLFSYPCMALIQSAVQHERVAIVTSLYLASYSIGSALGNTIAAGIWLNKMPGELSKQMTNYGVTNATMATYVYTDPVSFIIDFPVGTPERSAAIDSYAHLQRLLCTAGICIAALIFVVSLFLRNPYLGEEQTLIDAEGFVSTNSSSTQANHYSTKSDGSAQADGHGDSEGEGEVVKSRDGRGLSSA